MDLVFRDEPLTDEQKMIRDTVAEFVGASVAPGAAAIDADASFAPELMAELAELGLLSVPLPEASGGAGFDFVAFALVLAEIARECPALAQHVLLHTIGGVLPLSELDGLESEAGMAAMGEKLAAFISDAIDISFDASTGKVSGHGANVLLAPNADVFVVHATAASGGVLLLVDSSGAARGDSKNRLGMRGVHICDVSFDGADARVIAEGQACQRVVDLQLQRELVGALAIGAGLTHSVARIASNYAEEREQFGAPIARLGAVQEMMARADVAYRVTAELAFSLAGGIDRGEDVLVAARAARIVTGDMIMRAADSGLQVHGGYGFSQEYPIERLYRDARHIAVMGGCTDGLFAMHA